jgi:ATP-dependent Lon protease
LSEPALPPELSLIPDASPDADGIFTRSVILLGGAVVFPGIMTTVMLSTSQARSAVQTASKQGETVLLLPHLPTTDPDAEELPLGVATEAALGRLVRMPDEGYMALVQGRRRIEVLGYVQREPHLIARARIVPAAATDTRELTAVMQTMMTLFKRVSEINDNIPDDVLFHVMNAEDPAAMSDLVAATLSIAFEERLRLLNMPDPEKRLHHLALLLSQELNMLELKDEIAQQIQQEMDREQREVYLREQMRVIQSELGEQDFFQQEINDVREQIVKAQLPPEVQERAMKELSRLAIMSPLAPEVGMVRTYIDWLTSVPWNKASEGQPDLKHAQKILDDEHYGLPKVKDRILEYIAVLQLVKDKRNSPILCFVGPPGVGKTSLGKSIANALGRGFVRVSLGGVRDEAEIRGHRRTYIGALPGRIIQTMRRTGQVNPVFMLDEIDKLGSDFRGDPASALLEVLDPEQNHAFVDHYLDVPYDLSKVLFITTANDLDPLQSALLDRLEVIEFNGYTEEEKIAIARRFLIPRQLEMHGLNEVRLRFETSVLQLLIREYTYEAGVRNLEREIANVCRKIARMIAEGKRHPHRITAALVQRLLGPAPFDDFRANDKDEIGVATGLAWTPVGGDLLLIEAVVVPGKGNLTLTGSLGDIMQESAQAALSYLRARAETLGVLYDDFDSFDIHLHLPEGAVPKEGPSAGITLAVAIISAFTERKVRSSIAMTGEITLRGKVLPIGGVKEKVLAARRARIHHVLLPKQNEKDLVDIPKEALADMKITLVSDMEEVLELVLLEGPAVGERRLDRLREEREKAQGDDGEDET